MVSSPNPPVMTSSPPSPFIPVLLYYTRCYCLKISLPGTSSFEIIPNLIVSPFGVIENGVNGFNSIANPIQINTFQIGDSIYAGVYASFKLWCFHNYKYY